MDVERTFTVTTPIEKVFDYLADFTHTNEWDPGTIETRRISGGGEVGTTYYNKSEFAGRETELTYESVAQERPSRLQFRGTNKTATATDTLTRPVTARPPRSTTAPTSTSRSRPAWSRRCS